MTVTKILYMLGAFIAAFGLEKMHPFWSGTQRRVSDFLKNLSLFAMNGLLSLVFVMPITLFAASFNIWGRESSGFAMLLVHVLFLDFCIYWWHRANHRFSFLWRFHQIHHMDEVLDVSSSVRFHAGEVALSACARAVVIVALSIPFRDVIIFETVLLMASFFQHSNIGIPKWLDQHLHKFIVTPSIHWVHHHADAQDMNHNFCLLVSVWDRVFGTASNSVTSSDTALGIPNQRDDNLLRLLWLPFRR